MLYGCLNKLWDLWVFHDILIYLNHDNMPLQLLSKHTPCFQMGNLWFWHSLWTHLATYKFLFDRMQTMFATLKCKYVSFPGRIALAQAFPLCHFPIFFRDHWQNGETNKVLHLRRISVYTFGLQIDFSIVNDEKVFAHLWWWKIQELEWH